MFVGHTFKKNLGLLWTFADDLGVELPQSKQIGWSFQGRTKVTLPTATDVSSRRCASLGKPLPYGHTSMSTRTT